MRAPVKFPLRVAARVPARARLGFLEGLLSGFLHCSCKGSFNKEEGFLERFPYKESSEGFL